MMLLPLTDLDLWLALLCVGVVTISRTAMTDDDGTGTTGTIFNNAWKTSVYDQIDAALAQLLPLGGGQMTGLLDLSGVGAGQIKFLATQNSSTNANTLDDYEEGSWTAVIGGDGGTSGQTYTAQTGYYLKVGQLVWIAVRVVYSNKGTITGNLQLQGLPFTVNAGVDQVMPVVWHSLATTWVSITAVLTGNTTTGLLYGAAAAASSNQSNLVTGDVDNDSTFYVTGCYRASA